MAGAVPAEKQASLLERVFRAVGKGRKSSDIVEILKDAPKEAFGNPGEVAKAVGKQAEAQAQRAVAEELTDTAEIRAEAELLKMWMEKAETAEEREKVADFSEKWQQFRRETSSENRRARDKLQQVATKVLYLVAVAGAAIGLALLADRFGFEPDSP